VGSIVNDTSKGTPFLHIVIVTKITSIGGFGLSQECAIGLYLKIAWEHMGTYEEYEKLKCPKIDELECGPTLNVMAALANIGGAVCESSLIPFLVPRRKVRCWSDVK